MSVEEPGNESSGTFLPNDVQRYICGSEHINQMKKGIDIVLGSLLGQIDVNEYLEGLLFSPAKTCELFRLSVGEVKVKLSIGEISTNYTLALRRRNSGLTVELVPDGTKGLIYVIYHSERHCSASCLPRELVRPVYDSLNLVLNFVIRLFPYTREHVEQTVHFADY